MHLRGKVWCPRQAYSWAPSLFGSLPFCSGLRLLRSFYIVVFVMFFHALNRTCKSIDTQVQMVLDDGGLWDCAPSHIFEGGLSPRTLAEFPPKENERWGYRVFACSGARNRYMFMRSSVCKCQKPRVPLDSMLVKAKAHGWFRYPN